MHSLFTRNQRTLAGHNGAVNQAIFSPDGKRIVSASDDGTVKVWDAATGRHLQTLDGPHGAIKSIAFSPDGRRIVSGSETGTIKVWDVSTGHNELAIPASEETGSQLVKIAFSRDGKRIFGTDDTGIRAWDALTGRVATLTHPKSAHQQRLSRLLGFVRGAINFGPAGPSAGTRLSAQFDPEGLVTLKCSRVDMWTFPAENACPIIGPVTFDAHHSSLATTTSDGKLIVCNAATGKDVRILEALEQSLCISFSSDSRRIAIGNAAGNVKIVELESGKVLQVLNGHKAGVLSVVFSRDGQQLLSASSDKTLKVWSLAGESEIVQVPQFQRDYVFAITPGSTGDTLIARQSTRVDIPALIFSSTLYRPIQVAETGPIMAADKNGMIGASDDAFSLWDAVSGTRVLQWKNDHNCRFGGFSANVEKGLVAWVEHKEGSSTISVWDLKDRKRIAQLVRDHTTDVYSKSPPSNERPLFGSVALSSDGTKLAAADLDGRLRLCSLPTMREEAILESHVGAIRDIAFRPDGCQIAVADNDHGTITLLSTSDHPGSFIVLHPSCQINDMAFSPDGKRLASAGADKTVRLWNTDTGEEMLVLPKRPRQLQGVSFGPSANYIIGANSREIVVWDASDNSSDVRASLHRLGDQISLWNHVDSLMADALLKADVIEKLKSDKTLSKESRDRAIELATRREEDPVQLNNQSWQIASRPTSSLEEYKRALR